MVSIDRRVQVWTANAVCPQSTFGVLEGTLDSDERARAEKFRFDRHRRRYVFSRGVLRHILASSLRCDPRQISFDTNSYGKPFLRGQRDAVNLTFNVSHSEEMVAIAIANDRSVGIDVEFIRPVDRRDEIAHRYFVDEERSLMDSAPHHLKDQVFYVCWTRKEAYIKAVGKGLSIPLTTFGTAMPLGASGRVVRDEWWLTDLIMPSTYVGALVVQGTMPPQITYHEWKLLL